MDEGADGGAAERNADDGGDPPWHVLEGFDANAPKFPIRVRLNGEGILVFRYKDGYRGVERLCPHRQASLADAVLMANGTVLRCFMHNFTFKLADGKGVSPPNLKMRVFDIKIEDGIGYGRPAT
ncbi:MAG TPA: Rieske 2Fe-2S domain-containing protein [Stellaceae bacterium]|nr:Rieske 2Fe-2S domain-containing protein [Stellaceae bacterium]